MKLIITEKPSVAKSIVSALGVTFRADGCFEGNGLIVSWCVGHLVSPMDAAGYDPGYKKWRYDDLPVLPEPFRYVLVKDKEDAFQNLKRLMEREDVTELVNACDAGREGELIFRLVYEMAGCAKPFSRLWISSMEDAAIREGFANLRPGAEYDPLYQSALCRQKADWLIGINATRLFSVLYHRTLNVGRVQTPTLVMLVDRDWKITSFKKEKYHHVRLALDGAEAVSERITSLEEAEALRVACADDPAVCTAVTREQKKEAPPKFYDLTTLQREANRLFGYTAKQTLDYTQSLYEKKLLTYPRTDSRFLTADMAETAAAVLHLAVKEPPFDGCKEFFPDVSLLVNDGKVSDHHAIIPTLKLEKADLSALPVGERNLLLLVCREVLCAAAEPYVYEAVTATFECGGHTFTAKGRHVLSLGWKDIDRIFRASLKEKPEDEAEPAALPDFTKGQTFDQMEAAVTEHFHHQSDDGKYLIMGNGSRAFAIRNEEAQEHAAPEKMTVLVVEPRKEPYLKEIDPGLHSLQAEVGGDIAASYPFSDPVGLVCNDEGKLIGLELNRGLRDKDGNLYDIMAGTFLVVGLSEESFASLPPELAQKYMEHFKQPEQFISLNGQIIALPVEPENPLRTAEMTVEDDYGMIDGVINNGRKGEELEAAKGEARRTSPEKKPSIRERLEEAKKECGERKPPDKAHQKKPPEHDL